MRTWKDIDWNQPRPVQREVVYSLSRLRWEARSVESLPVSRYLEQVRETHANGGVLVGRWRAVNHDDVSSWFMSRNRLEEYELHRAFFDDPTVRQGLAPLKIPPRLDRPVPGGLEEVPKGSLQLGGELAAVILYGGAYNRFQGPASEAKDLAEAAVDDITERRYEDFRLDRSYDAWTPWFFDVAWDYTFVLTDHRKAELTVLCITDTD